MTTPPPAADPVTMAIEALDDCIDTLKHGADGSEPEWVQGSIELASAALAALRTATPTAAPTATGWAIVHPDGFVELDYFHKTKFTCYASSDLRSGEMRTCTPEEWRQHWRTECRMVLARVFVGDESPPTPNVDEAIRVVAERITDEWCPQPANPRLRSLMHEFIVRHIVAARLTAGGSCTQGVDNSAAAGTRGDGEWVKVEDRLPDEGAGVIGCIVQDGFAPCIFLATYCRLAEDRDPYWCHDLHDPTAKPTHWMPRPQLPAAAASSDGAGDGEKP